MAAPTFPPSRSQQRLQRPAEPSCPAAKRNPKPLSARQVRAKPPAVWTAADGAQFTRPNDGNIHEFRAATACAPALTGLFCVAKTRAVA